MITTSAHEFFLASAAVAGALIGLLFVAISVSRESVSGPDASAVHEVSAAAALTAFTNALTVALFGLIPQINVGAVAETVAIVGLLFVVGGLVRVIPGWRAKRRRLDDVVFLIGLLVVFVIQLIAGLGLDRRSHDANDLETICVLVVVCFLIGIARAWELVGGPSVRLSHQILEGLWPRDEADKGDGPDGA